MSDWYTENDFDPDGEIYRPFEEIPVGSAQDVEQAGLRHGIKGREFDYEEARKPRKRSSRAAYMREYRARKRNPG